MKKVIIALTAIVAMASCKKESLSPAPEPAVTKNLVKETDVYNNGTPEINEYSYDAQGKISVLKEDTRTSTFNFLSATSLIVTQKKNADNSLERIYECTLNDKGYVTRKIAKSPAGAINGIYEYTYNAEGYMINKKFTDGNGSVSEVVYQIVDGNLASSNLYYDNVHNSTSEYTFDKTKTNKKANSHGSFWSVYNLFGKGSINFVTESKVFNTGGALTWHARFTWELDADGYPAKQITNNILLGTQGVTTYIYQ